MPDLYRPIEKEAYAGAVLSDLHNGALPADVWYYEMEKAVLNKLDKLMILDFVIIAGDLFHTKISMNSEHGKVLILFLNRLLSICKRKGTKFRILKGTESHDNNQLYFVENYIKSSPYSDADFRVIHSVESEWLFPDMHVLYIPEEYMDDQESFYAPYFEQEYDMIFGHGMIQEAVHAASSQESEMPMARAPIFDTKKLLSICKGPVFFGHVHSRIIVKKRFHYINSTSRWEHGEEGDKGYYLVLYSPVNFEFRTQYVKNKWARRFETVEIQVQSDNEPDEQVKAMMNIVDNLSETREYLRLEVHIPEDYPSPNLLIRMMNEVFANYKKFKLKINNNSNLVQQKEVEKRIAELHEQYDYVYDPKIAVEVKLSRFIQDKYGRNITVDQMRHYLYSKHLTGA